MQSIIDNKGIGSEASYPYEAKDDKCRTVPSVATIVGFTDVPANSDTALMTAIVQQPISVAIEADQAVFQSYKVRRRAGRCGAGCGECVRRDRRQAECQAPRQSRRPSTPLSRGLTLLRRNSPRCPRLHLLRVPARRPSTPLSPCTSRSASPRRAA